MKRNSSFYVFVLPLVSDHLSTVALRPTLMYGECDERFFPTIMRLADRWKGKIPRIAEGGKKQLSYVGESSLLESEKLCLFAQPSPFSWKKKLLISLCVDDRLLRPVRMGNNSPSGTFRSEHVVESLLKT